MNDDLQQLSPAARCAILTRHRDVWQARHPETSNGSKGKGRARDKQTPIPWRFAASKRFGITTRTAYIYASIGTRIGHDRLRRIVGTSLDTLEDLRAVSRLRGRVLDTFIAHSIIDCRHKQQKVEALNRVAATL